MNQIFIGTITINPIKITVPKLNVGFVKLNNKIMGIIRNHESFFFCGGANLWAKAELVVPFALSLEKNTELIRESFVLYVCSDQIADTDRSWFDLQCGQPIIFSSPQLVFDDRSSDSLVVRSK
ncbi:hypothetical protein [Fischerella thermalis]|uniref:hypothetical protein n=1 Tax=Fischerella thermalis TaxID=372787 RepID=UPI0011AEF690|nr:hypothetical protein [Fischerella thermalis]